MPIRFNDLVSTTTSPLPCHVSAAEAFTDEALAAAYRTDGDPEVLGQLYARYLELIYGLCLHYLRDAGRAEDASMDVYEQLVTKLRQHEVATFRSWLYQLARNHCLMILRRRGPSQLTRDSSSVRVNGQLDLADMQFEGVLHQDEDDEAHAAIRTHDAHLDALSACTDELNERQATCIRRFYLEGASYEEIGTEIKATFDQVRSAIQNGRRNLKTCVERKTQHVHR